MPRSTVILGLFLLTPCLGLGHSNEVSYQSYEKDEHTLHLWHLDGKGPPFLDSGISQTPLCGPRTGISFHFNVGGTPRKSDLRGGILLAAPTSTTSPPSSMSAPGPKQW